ncbi:ABC transporter substrate-binding protein [Streptomyces sp. MST-110588]|uniref:ABC transporter substrate-binding protein n=1 Tax=Streptomyces sp. MST-110588 TaxID=2833628 RepID=UPI001F5CE37E|nr:ABC transporter substrate-binding protein [Streptomyces sp. MST-110588]UNO42647.1 ABC transporter substrate-binding protein [Streptomyces sp. MST-110588]
MTATVTVPRRAADSGTLRQRDGAAGSGPARRSVLAAGGALGAGALLTACGNGGGPGTDGSSGAAAGSWSFRDDRGKKVTAGVRPRRIVGYIASVAALHDFGVGCTGYFGPATYPNGRPTPQAGTLDLGGLTAVGSNHSDFSIEKYAALRPELLVSNMNQPPLLWMVPQEGAEKILGLAPSVGITTARTSLLTAIERYAALAASLGADLKDERVTGAKARFERAARRLRAAAGAKKGLKVLAVAAQPDTISAGVPTSFADVRYYSELGVEFVVPRKPGRDGFWENRSWENADLYDADVIFLDQRPNNVPMDELARSKPTWSRLPAVKAGQVVAWNNEAQYSYAGYAPLLERLADAVERAHKVT